MRRELLGLKHLSIEGADGSRLHDLDLLVMEGECICLVSAVHQKEVLVEYLEGKGKTLTGSLYLQRREIDPDSRQALEREKIFVIGRDTPYMNTLSIGENIFVLRRNSLKKFKINERAMELQTRYYFEKYGIDMDLKTDSSRLGMGDKFIISVIRSVSQGARLIVLHDFSRAFSKSESVRLLSLIKGLKSDGIGVLISDNHPEYFYPETDQLVIFKHRQIAKKIYEPEEFGLAHEIIMRGAAAVPESDIKDRHQEAAAVEIRGFKLNGAAGSIRGARGEIVLVARDGAVMERIWNQFMEFPNREITYTVDGNIIPYRTMTDLIRQRVVFVSLEVFYGGVMGNLSKEDNILMPSFPKISSRLGFYRKQSAYIFQDDFLLGEEKRLSDMDMGENNWKTVFYRWKLYHPRVLILYNTLTVADVQERDWIKNSLREMADRGTTVILLENEASYCAGIADRIETMDDGEGENGDGHS